MFSWNQKSEPEPSKATQLAVWLANGAIKGCPGFKSAEEVANDYIKDPKYRDCDARVKSLIRWHTANNFGTGFVTGLGGFMALPIAIPADLLASWAIQARMVAAIAKIYGHDISDDRVKTAVLLALVGQDIKEVLKRVGITIGEKITYKIIEKIPGAILTKINQAVGFRLLTKFGTKGVINLCKLIPGVSGLIGGTIDAVTCWKCGKFAKKIFQPEEN